MAARDATAMAIGASIAAVATFPGPSDAMTRSEHEEHHRDEARIAPADANRGVCDSVERSVELRLGKEQRHACQRQKQLRREAAQHVVEAHAPEVDADDPRERQCQHAHVDAS